MLLHITLKRILLLEDSIVLIDTGYAFNRVGVSLTVESTRWTLKKLLKDKVQCEKKFEWLKSFLPENYKNWLMEYCNFLIEMVEILPNDIAKLFLLESYPATFVLTLNARALRHMFELRLPKNAHFIFRELMQKIKDVLPEHHYIFYEDIFEKN